MRKYGNALLPIDVNAARPENKNKNLMKVARYDEIEGSSDRRIAGSLDTDDGAKIRGITNANRTSCEHDAN